MTTPKKSETRPFCWQKAMLPLGKNFLASPLLPAYLSSAGSVAVKEEDRREDEKDDSGETGIKTLFNVFRGLPGFASLCMDIFSSNASLCLAYVAILSIVTQQHAALNSIPLYCCRITPPPPLVLHHVAYSSASSITL